jgi:hypothetical protein
MYRVEINGSEVLMDLIGRMADLAGAEYQTRLVLETESWKLAWSVGMLLAEPVVDKGLSGLALGLKPEVSEEKPSGGLGEHVWNFNADPGGPIVVTHEGPVNGKANGKPAAEAGSPKCRYCGKAIAQGRSMCQGAECQRKAKHEQDERYAEKRKEKTQARLAAKSYGTCEFCEMPRLPRSKICGSAECNRMLNQKHQLAYQARKAEKAAQAEPAAAQGEEAATSEGPLSLGTEPMYKVDFSDKLITFEDLVALNKSGKIPDGVQVLAQPSGRWYTVRGGSLTRVDQGGTGKGR